jgi:hypothetical protein
MNMQTPRARLHVFALAVLCAVVLVSGFSTDLAQAQGSGILWTGDHEEGSLADWSLGSGGGEFNDAGPDSTPSQDRAHSGRWSARMTVPNGSLGTRLFRWAEAMQHRSLYYSGWFYVPSPFSSQWNTFFEYKSKTSTRNDPFWFLQLHRRSSNGPMYLVLTRANQSIDGGANYTQNVMDFPTGQWVHVEIFLKQSTTVPDGEIAVWQDGVELYRRVNVWTKYPDGIQAWAACNYGAGLPPSHSIYVDDAAISLTRVGPGADPTAGSPAPPTDVRVFSIYDGMRAP